MRKKDWMESYASYRFYENSMNLLSRRKAEISYLSKLFLVISLLLVSTLVTVHLQIEKKVLATLSYDVLTRRVLIVLNPCLPVWTLWPLSIHTQIWGCRFNLYACNRSFLYWSSLEPDWKLLFSREEKEFYAPVSECDDELPSLDGQRRPTKILILYRSLWLHWNQL